jgi:2-dehydro-3-deoxyphosphogluconate aldolase / (4S)-4-hydroxy-2-oxoglutarate aldolase
MISSDTVKQICRYGIVPIVRARDENKIAVAADALVKAGLGVLEISLSVATGLKILESLADRFGDTLLLGAGTVLDAVTARDAVSAGARFIVSPSTDDSVIDTCKSMSVAVFPGALTPTEIVYAWKSGADAIKVFPISAVGGPPYIRAVLAPLPDLVLFPCGGVTAANAADYFAAGAAALLLGSSLINMTAPERDLSDSVVKNASLFLNIVQKARTQAS